MLAAANICASPHLATITSNGTHAVTAASTSSASQNQVDGPSFEDLVSDAARPAAISAAHASDQQDASASAASPQPATPSAPAISVPPPATVATPTNGPAIGQPANSSIVTKNPTAPSDTAAHDKRVGSSEAATPAQDVGTTASVALLTIDIPPVAVVVPTRTTGVASAAATVGRGDMSGAAAPATTARDRSDGAAAAQLALTGEPPIGGSDAPPETDAAAALDRPSQPDLEVRSDDAKAPTAALGTSGEALQATSTSNTSTAPLPATHVAASGNEAAAAAPAAPAVTGLDAASAAATPAAPSAAGAPPDILAAHASGTTPGITAAPTSAPDATGAAPSGGAAADLAGEAPASVSSSFAATATTDANGSTSIRVSAGELGTIEVRLGTGDDGGASVTVAADRADTLNVMAADRDGMQSVLAQAGVEPAGRRIEYTLLSSDGPSTTTAGPGDGGAGQGGAQHGGGQQGGGHQGGRHGGDPRGAGTSWASFSETGSLSQDATRPRSGTKTVYTRRASVDITA